MKIIRYLHASSISYGILDGETVREIHGGLFDGLEETSRKLNFGDVTLLCPCEPSKVLAIGLNYRSHLGDRSEPKEPAVFYIPTSALLKPEGTIQIPADAEDVHYEGELVAIIGTELRNATTEEAADGIFGFTCGNDISERTWQKNDLQWWRAKGCDTFAPLGPVITTDFDWFRGGIRTLLNGAVVQEGRFSELLFDPPGIIRYISQYVTLYPGDVIYTGTPGKTRALKSGDRIEVQIDEIGSLMNNVT
jgi:2-keto-4-pentenoate hydratase/2-oxohepta-3-ene-1,7-dioic acid hydratase in catechol pathway